MNGVSIHYCAVYQPKNLSDKAIDVEHWFKRILLLCLLGALWIPSAWGTTYTSCSPYKGQMFINEVFIGSSGSLSTANRVEIYNSGNIPSSVWGQFSVVSYNQQGSSVPLKSPVAYLSSFLQNGQFIYSKSSQFQFRNNAVAVRNSDVALVDANGALIDYIDFGTPVYNGSPVGVNPPNVPPAGTTRATPLQVVPACFTNGQSLSNYSIFSNGNASNGDIARQPDGGSWPSQGNSTSVNTMGSTNVCLENDLPITITPSTYAAVPPYQNVVTYTVVVTNNGCIDKITNIATQISGLPATAFSNITISSYSSGTSKPVINASTGVITWSVGSLQPAGGKATMVFTALPILAGNYSTVASITAGGACVGTSGSNCPGALNNSLNDETSSAPLTVVNNNLIGWTVPSDSVEIGSDISYTAYIQSLVPPNSTVTINYTVSATGLGYAAYTGTSLSNGSVTLNPAGANNQTSITFNLLDNYTPSNTVITLTITSISSADNIVKLNNAANTLNITIQLPACGTIDTTTISPAFPGLVSTLGNLTTSSTMVNGTSANFTNAYVITSTGASESPTSNNLITTLPAVSPAAFVSTTSTTTTAATSLLPGSFGTVTASGTTTFAAGNYYITNMSASGTINLNAGKYFIHSLSAAPSTSFVIQTSPVIIYTDYYVSLPNYASMNTGGSAGNLQLYVYGSGLVQLTNYASFTGLIYSTSSASTIQISNYASIVGAVLSDGMVNFSGGASVTQSSSNQTQLATISSCGAGGSTPTLDHLIVQHATGQGLTCAQSTVTILACADSGCATNYTGGVVGSLTASTVSGTPNITWSGGTSSFTIPSGSSSVTESFQNTVASTISLGTTNVGPAPASVSTCNFGSPSCNFVTSSAGFLISSIANHIACNAQSFTIQAIQQSQTGNSCVPGFQNVSRTVSFGTSYNNPSTGSNVVTVNGSTSPSLAFDGTGTAGATMIYPDAGQVTMSANYTGSASTGDTGLSMSAVSAPQFIAAPASLSFSNLPSAPLTAGVNNTATISALNACTTPSAMPNFGKESTPQLPVISGSKLSPTGTAARTGNISGSVGTFSAGAAPVTFSWDDVGTISLGATVNNYLSSGLNASGSSGSIGPFVPSYFQTVTTPGCVAGNFTYSAQPFGVSVTAFGAGGVITQNFDGSANTSPNYADSVTLSDANLTAGGNLANTNFAKSQFLSGIATVSASSNSPVWTYNAQTATPTSTSQIPVSIKVRATDATYASISSNGHEIPAANTIIRGWLRVNNFYGKTNSALLLPVQALYWTGLTWAINASDQCTSFASSAVSLSSYSSTGWATSASGPTTLINGTGVIQLTTPTPTNSTGTVSLSVDLGASGVDQSCLATHGGIPANLSWLRSRNGACVATWDRDPSATASFGIYAPETRKTVHIHEILN